MPLEEFMISPEHDAHQATLHDDSADEGWYALRQRARQALTHFAPPAGELADEWHHAAHWALLPAELWETADSVELSLEVPGMQAERLDVEMLGNKLVVRGERVAPEDAAARRQFIRERAYGRFQRTFHLPAAVNEDLARARYRDGVLCISLPKTAQRHDQRIRVDAPT